MKIFVVVSLVLALVNFFVRLASLTIMDYPRVVKYNRVEDALRAIEALGIAAWTGILLMKIN